MTTDHPQHSSNPSAAFAVRTMTLNLRDLAHAQIARGIHVAPISHREVLAAAANQSSTFIVKPASMPTGGNA
ncbi:MAG: hypothetical protein WAW39_17165 [Prosthecobacter sp.]|uniref:hypothetical protein n=1 Tax=Prosthecobacter sp. TaxID=1965333 RepID=UPI003BB1A2B1